MDNIFEYCLKEYGWSNNEAKQNLEHAVHAGYIVTTLVNNKVSYRRKPQIISIEDCVNSVAVQTETPVNDVNEIKTDIDEIKKYIYDEVQKIRKPVR